MVLHVPPARPYDQYSNTRNADAAILEAAAIILIKRSRKPKSLGMMIITRLLRAVASDLRK